MAVSSSSLLGLFSENNQDQAASHAGSSSLWLSLDDSYHSATQSGGESFLPPSRATTLVADSMGSSWLVKSEEEVMLIIL